jgi:hypothetical protein
VIDVALKIKTPAQPKVSSQTTRPLSVSSELRRVAIKIRKMGPKAQIELMLSAWLTTPAKAANAIRKLEKPAGKAPRKTPV